MTLDLLVRSRSAMLDALAALRDHRDAVIVIGAQAVYLRTNRAPVALAEATKDSDLALDPRALVDNPHIEDAMERAGFYPNPADGQPGAWLNAEGIPVDLMVPEALAGPGSRTTRGARIPPHDRRAARRARGLEAAVVDNSIMDITALDDADHRHYQVRVAGPAALIVAKIHKIAEQRAGPVDREAAGVDNSVMDVTALDDADHRHCSVRVAGTAALIVAKIHKIAERVSAPHRLNDKDAHDIYRILIAVDTVELRTAIHALLRDPLSADTTRQAMTNLREFFAVSPDALGAVMAGRAEEGIGEPLTVALSSSILAADLLDALDEGAEL